MKRFLPFLAVALLMSAVSAIWAPLQFAGAETYTAANKIGVAASDLQVLNQTQLPNDKVVQEVELFSSTFKTSTTEDLLMTVNAECGLYTAVGAKGKYDPLTGATVTTSSTATGQMIVWLVLDDKPIATTLTSDYRVGDPNANPPTTGNGPVVFCNRAFNLSTQDLLAPQLITLFIRTRDAHSFTWFAKDVGNGDHTLKVMASLVAETASEGNDGSVTITYVTPAASALVGQRTLVVEPVHLMNSATW